MALEYLVLFGIIDTGKCTECDEVFYTGDMVEQIEQIIAAAKTLTQELMVVDYTSAA